MITSHTPSKNKIVFRGLKVWLLWTAVAFILAGCGGSATEHSEPDVIVLNTEDSSNIPSTDPVDEDVPSPTSTPDPRIAIANEMLLLAKQANDFYIHGNKVAWRETKSEIIAYIGEADGIAGSTDSLTYDLLGYESEEALLADIANLTIIDAYENYNNDHLEIALEKFNEAIDSGVTQLSAAYSGRGHVLRRQGNIEDAIFDFNQAIDLNPENADAYRGLAMIAYYNQGNLATANEYIDKALSINPSFGRVYFLRGDIVYDELGDTASTEALYNQGLQYDPKDAENYYNRALLYDRTGRDAECVNDMNTAINLNPYSAWYYYQRGYCLMGTGYNALALDDFNESIALVEPASELTGYAYAGKGDAYFYLEKYDEAIDAFSIAVGQYPDNANFYEWRGDAYRLAEDYSAAIDDYSHVLMLDSSRAWSYFGLGLAHDSLDDYQDAYANYEVYLKMEPGDMPGTRYACDRMNALHLYNAQNLFDMFLGTGCNRFPSDSSGTVTSGTNNDSEDLLNCPHGVMEGRCMSWTEYDQSAHTP